MKKKSQFKLANSIQKQDWRLLNKLADGDSTHYASLTCSTAKDVGTPILCDTPLDPKQSKIGKIHLCHKALHPELSYPLVAVAELSTEKGYAPFNWLKPDSAATSISYWLNAAQRHLDKVKMGVDLNTEEFKQDGTSTITQPNHAAQAAYCLLCLLLLQKQGLAVDDRLFKDGKLNE